MTYVRRDEAHEDYHLWSAFVVMASLIGRKLWVTRPYQRVYPNIYVILIGPQGNRKTAAKILAQKVLKDVGGIPFSSESTTREDLIKKMSEQEQSFEADGVTDTYAPMTICVNEFKEFLAIDPARMIHFITHVYDADYYDYSVRGRPEPDIIYNPYLCILACETPEWIVDRLKDKIVTGGFSRRVLYIYQTAHYRYVDTEMPPECVAAHQFILKDAQRVRDMAGEMKFSAEARKWYDHWYINYAMPEETSMVGFYESKHTMLTKIAMLVSASENSARVIELNHFQLALSLIEQTEKNMPRLFAGGGRNELSTVAIKITDLLERVGGPISEEQVLVALFHDCRDNREAESVLAHLYRSKKAVRFLKGNVPYLCSISYLPESVRKLIGHVGDSKSDSAVAGGLQSAPSIAPADLPVPPPSPQPTSPSVSAEPTAEPQIDEVQPSE